MNSADKLRRLINDTNLPPKEFTERNLRLDLPVTEIGEGYNTKLEIEGIPGRGYYGTEEVFYRRIDLSTINRQTPVRTTVPLTAQVVLDLFNSVTALFLTIDDVEPFTPPVLNDGDSGEVTIVAVENSLGFTGSAVIPLEFGRSWLDSVVGSRNLPVLVHPIVRVDYRRSARMMTWSKDFTCLRDSLLPNPKTGLYSDWSRLQAACLEMGIPAWAQNGIIDYATSAVSDSNPLFDRVVIQRNVSSAQMLGDLYFHYNILEEV
jgi:hypothetical protein